MIKELFHETNSKKFKATEVTFENRLRLYFEKIKLNKQLKNKAK